MAWGAPGAALAGVLSGLVGALAGGWMQQRAGLPLRLDCVLRPALAAAIGGGVAAMLPFAWPLQALAGGAAYVVTAWLLGALSTGDVALLRRTLRGIRA